MPRAPLDVAASPSDPAAIYYTSGSTGRPKGVVKSHRALLHRAWLSAKYDRVSPADRQSLLTYCSFASSEADVFGALLNGATVETFDVATRGLDAFGEWVDDRRVTLLHPPVVLFRRYLATLDGATLDGRRDGGKHHPSVRLVALAGEAVTPADVEQWRRRFSPGCSLRHRFSSSEAGHVAVACVGPIASMPERVATLPPATPVADKHLSVVDDAGREAPAGEPGELVVRSAFLADGYWRRPTRPPPASQPDPDHPGERRFHTGDLGRLLPGGGFEFLGRRDHQVKIRGYRVELREVEQAMLALPGVKEAAVIAAREGDETRLIGFVVPHDTHAQSRRRRAPMPCDRCCRSGRCRSRFTSTDAMPLTLTGKIDRRALATRVSPAGNGAVAPSDDRLAQVTAVWEVLLGRPGIKPDDDFFNLGGHSLLAAQLVHEMNRRFGRSLTPAALVAAPTVRRLVDLLDGRRADGRGQRDRPLVPLRASGTYSPLFFVPVVGGTAATYLPLARLLIEDQPVYALQFGLAGAAANEAGSVEDIARRFVTHVRLMRPSRPIPLVRPLVRRRHRLRDGAATPRRGRGGRVARHARRPGARLPPPAAAAPPGAGPRAPPRRRRRRDWTAARPPISLGGYDAGPVKRQTRCRHLPRFGGGRGRPRDIRRALRAYRPPAYAGTITLFRAAVPPDGAAFDVPEPMNGWDACCPNVDVHPVPGDHLSILREPNLSVLARAVERLPPQTRATRMTDAPDKRTGMTARPELCVSLLSSTETPAWNDPGSVTPALAAGDVHVWRLSLARIDPTPYRALAETLSPDEHARASRFHFEADRRRYAIGRGTLREVLSRYLNARPPAIAFEYGAGASRTSPADATSSSTSATARTSR